MDDEQTRRRPLARVPSLDERYEFEAVRQGGQANVHLARELASGTPVAIKIYKTTDEAGQESAQVRYEASRQAKQEADLLRRLDHPRIPRCLEQGDDKRGPYLVLNHFDGISLEEHRKKSGGRLAASEVMRLGRVVAQVLRAVHECKLVHRDIKPSNILLVGADDVAVLDFGSAADIQYASELSRARVPPALTDIYKAPEIGGDNRGDERSDVYSLGRTLLCLLTGSPKEERGASPDEAPDGLRQWVRRMICTEPDERPADMGEVIARLDALLHPPSEPMSGSSPSVSRAHRRRVSPWWVLAGLVVLISAAVVLGWLGQRSTEEITWVLPKPPAPPSELPAPSPEPPAPPSEAPPSQLRPQCDAWPSPPGCFVTISLLPALYADDTQVPDSAALFRLTQPVDIGITEVTQGEWFRVMGTKPSYFADCGDDCPVERVSRYDAMLYLNALSARAGLDPCYALVDCVGLPGEGCLQKRCYQIPGNFLCTAYFEGTRCTGFRLPTDAEWLLALGDGKPGWSNANSGQRAHPVCRGEINGAGLCDMLGNISEMVQDVGGDQWPGLRYFDPLQEGPPPNHGNVLSMAEHQTSWTHRGASWFDPEEHLIPSRRRDDTAWTRANDVGFRVARSLPCPGEQGGPQAFRDFRVTVGVEMGRAKDAEPPYMGFSVYLPDGIQLFVHQAPPRKAWTYRVGDHLGRADLRPVSLRQRGRKPDDPGPQPLPSEVEVPEGLVAVDLDFESLRYQEILPLTYERRGEEVMVNLGSQDQRHVLPRQPALAPACPTIISHTGLFDFSALVVTHLNP